MDLKLSLPVTDINVKASMMRKTEAPSQTRRVCSGLGLGEEKTYE
jgi:hypothetical protein